MTFTGSLITEAIDILRIPILIRKRIPISESILGVADLTVRARSGSLSGEAFKKKPVILTDILKKSNLSTMRQNEDGKT